MTLNILAQLALILAARAPFLSPPYALMALGLSLVIFSLVFRAAAGLSCDRQASPGSFPVTRWESWQVSVRRAEFSRAWTPWGTCLFPSLD